MKSKRILVLQGNPDARGRHFGHALASAYCEAAQAAGHAIRAIDVAALDFPLLQDKRQWEEEDPPAAIKRAQEAIAWAEHLVIVFPLWLGAMPASFKAFLEQALRPGFALGKSSGARLWTKLLSGKTAHVVVTMGMPAWVYRYISRAHSIKSLESDILRFCGIKPARRSLIGSIESKNGRVRNRWLERMRAYGEQAK